MNFVIRRSLCAAVLAGGLLALGAGAANTADQSIAGVGDSIAVVVATAPAQMALAGSGWWPTYSAAPTQMALAGSGWWPTYSAAPTLI